MAHVIRNNSIYIAGMLLCIIVGLAAAPLMTSVRGAASPLVLGSSSGILGFLVVTMAVLATCAIGGMVGRMLHPPAGMYAAGIGIALLAWRMGSVTEVGYLGQQGTVYGDGIFLAILAAAGISIIYAIAGPMPGIEPDDDGNMPHPVLSVDAARAAAAGLAVIPVVLFLAASPHKGQTLGVAIIASIFAGLASRLLAPHVQPKLIFVSTIIGGLVAFAIGSYTMAGSFEDLAALKDLPPLCRPMPIDYLAGSFIGVPAGLSWATSFLHHDDEHDS
ncbi:MAG: hypothetical protein AAF432_09505 [Planctomycetota bacterium]